LQIAVAHLAEDWQILGVEEVVVEFDDVLELRTDRRQRGFQVLERLHRLQAKVAAQFAVAVEPELAGDIDEAGGGRGLDHVGVAGRLGQGLWINEADLVHGVPLCRDRDSRTTYAESLKANQYVTRKSASAIVRWFNKSWKPGDIELVE